jgi:hypothetical protein
MEAFGFRAIHPRHSWLVITPIKLRWARWLPTLTHEGRWIMTSVNEWAQQQWGAVEFGDTRLNARALAIGTAIAMHPDSSLPSQMNDWSDLKAAYRFLHHASAPMPA